LISLLARIRSTIEVSSTTTTRSASSGVVASNEGLAAWTQLQQAVDGGRFVPGQFGQPLGGPAGRGGQHHLGPLGPGQRHDRTDRKALPAPRPSGQHRYPRGQRQPHRFFLLRGQRRAGAAP
jgi:hypothetical protein